MRSCAGRQDQTEVSQLPDWAGDLANLLGIVTGAVTVVGWVVSYLFPKEPLRSRPLYEPQRESRRPRQPPSVTLSGELRTAIFNFIIRPHIGIAQEFGIAVVLFILFAVAGYFYVSGNPEDVLPSLPIFVLLRDLLLRAIRHRRFGCLFGRPHAVEDRVPEQAAQPRTRLT